MHRSQLSWTQPARATEIQYRRERVGDDDNCTTALSDDAWRRFATPTQGDDETFTVALDTANLPASLTAGSPASVTVTIDDSETTLTPIATWPNAPTGLAAAPAARHS